MPSSRHPTILLAAALVAGAGGSGPAQQLPIAPPLRHIFGLKTTMRDGVRLASDLWLPPAEGRYPVVLIRTPYLKGLGFLAPQGEYFARRGYAVVVQDSRGRGDSEGEFSPFFAEARDGYDTIETLANEPWSNGRVGMIGGSYMGSVQWLAARERPPHLVAIAPTSPGARFMNELPYSGGALGIQFALQWLSQTALRGPQNNATSMDWARIFAHRPLRTMDAAMGRPMPIFREWLDHDTLDDYWRRIYLTEADFRGIRIPILQITGLFDADQPGAMFTWTNVESLAPGGEHRYLVVGPWTHGQSVSGGRAEAGNRKFPPQSVIDNNGLIFAFFERYLKQSSVTFDQPHARVFLTGSNVWRDFPKYPVAEARPVSWFLSSGGRANTSGGDGALTVAGPTGAPADSFTFDPRNPVFQTDPAPVTSFTIEFGVSEDRSAIQRRNDVLVYTSPVLDRPLDVVGLVEVELWASTDGRDTDFTAGLSDLDPDGKSISLGPLPIGIVRARYRNGRPSLLEPGRPYRFRIELGHVAHTFLPGHRIRLDVSSSAYPLFNPNQNTGNPIADDVEWRIARQTIHHTPAMASVLRLPVLGDVPAIRP